MIIHSAQIIALDRSARPEDASKLTGPEDALHKIYLSVVNAARHSSGHLNKESYNR